ncbi:Zinc knuckle CX2CX4HX4C [Arabidopsis suecica]|uniref:Zinc knuckle CX2CX4HX4C n=1 Tax=Arabidopsis suecica TaxID=45249 RepID=A0A8T2BTR6_ARASU|nr:Zinc knuckle CX2CX4HX4C [Arabidopsis suecica]
MDRAMMAMSLEEEDIPLDMPDLPEYSSSKENELSLVGRLLNPECQSMKNLIRNMPRKWQKVGRVRGVALSRERFQFFFNSEFDLVDVLEKGLHTFDEWTVVVDRWYEVPPDNYLQFTPMWIQIWNLPINYYTHKAITLLGDQIGQVKEVVFDKDKPQIEDFVRVNVLFDVSRPLRRSKVVNLPKGGTATVCFEYERVQKRCYECQRMTHEKDVCPFLIKKRQEAASVRRAGETVERVKKAPFLKESDPLFGVLGEEQVGIDPSTGRPRIAPIVLEGMRQYLRVSSEEEKLLRIDKVKQSVGEVEKDPLAQKSILRLEPMPIFHADAGKGKGHVFNYETVLSPAMDSGSVDLNYPGQGPQDLETEALEMFDRSWLTEPRQLAMADSSASFLALAQPFQTNPTVFSSSLFEAGSSGSGVKKVKARKRPSKNNRKPKPVVPNLDPESLVISCGVKKGLISKRKAVSEGKSTAKSSKLNPQEEIRKKYFPEIVFLMETMHGRNVLVDLQVWMGYDRVLTVEPIGKCGGLAVFCKNNVQVDVIFMDKNLIDLQVQFGENNFFLSCVYGDPDESNRKHVWEKLMRLGISRKDRWCMMGDFNAILHNGEKNGGPRRCDSFFKPFAEMISVCDMEEMVSQGNRFTWAGRRGDHWIQSRLDRAFGNKEWIAQFPASNQVFLDLRGSDHRPVLVNLMSSPQTYRGQFRFDKRFLFKPGVKKAIMWAWNSRNAHQGFNVAERLKACRKALSSWKRNNNMNSQEKIHKCEAALEKAQSEVWPNRQSVFSLKKELAFAYREEEKYWFQKTRQKWLRSGNRNSQFFHAAVKDSRSRKRIDSLLDRDGVLQRSEAAKGEVAASYFQNLFKSSNPVSFEMRFSGFIPKVTEEMNRGLIEKVSAEEIKEAVFSIKASSAPGPDGMTAMFFQRYWKTVSAQVISEVQLFFENGVMPKEWNYTHLCLIPKIHHSSDMKDLRPISLCSVLYKVISNVIVKRLQPLLPLLVSVNQSAFVADRLITDNILVAHELVHSLKTHPATAANFMALKSDMSKAYDRVEWCYLRALLLAMGFHLRWVEWIMACVSTVTFSVLMNDLPFGMITPQRGLRQGDPLSPFLFVMCTEGLTHLLNKAQREGKINGIKFSEEGPEVHHLLFADDSLFLCRATKDQSLALQSILNWYGSVTGQVINPAKSSITFGSNVCPGLKTEIQLSLGISNEGGAGTYLGLPECFSGSKVELLSYIKDRLSVKLSGWYARNLSQGGKEVLLKSVALAMPIFAMSCFKLPKTTCDNLASAMADFWWSSSEQSRNVHWLSWEKLCLPKCKGGMGFRDIPRFNQALLSKQAWRILQFPDCLLAGIMKSRYFPETSFLEAPAHHRPSFAWRSILHGKELLVKGIEKRIGNGKSWNVWIDPWIEDEDEGMRAPMRRNYFFDVSLRVCDLIDSRTRDWDQSTLEDLFFPEDILRVKKIKPVVSQSDFWVWKHNKSGDFSVKSAYWLASQELDSQVAFEANALPSVNGLKEEVWQVQTDPKIKVFLWKMLCGAIPVVHALNRRGMSLDDTCQICGVEQETSFHVLFSCTYARQVWALSQVPNPLFGFHNGSVFSNIHHLLVNRKNKEWPADLRRSFPWVLWRIWKNRNTMAFEGKCFSALDSAEKVREDVFDWFEAQIIEPEVEEGDDDPAISIVPQEEVLVRDKWQAPPEGWVKCNISSSWSNRNRLAGGAWVVRDSSGFALLHSRRAFSGLVDAQEASFACLQWGIHCMLAHRFTNVIFAFQDPVLVGVLNRPSAWPSFKFQEQELKVLLSQGLVWKMVLESSRTNRGASLIAQSVTSDFRLQSYVAVGFPSWLRGVFEDESASASV